MRPGAQLLYMLTPLPSHVALMQSKGDEGRYWRVLSDAGITRQRLESFDRPIKASPQFFADKKVSCFVRARGPVVVQIAKLPAFKPCSVLVGSAV